MSRRWSVSAAVVAVLTLAAVFALAKCGIGAEDTAREVVPPPGPYRALPSQLAGPLPPGTFVTTLFLVRDDRLVPVVRRVSGEPGVADLVRELLAGPTDTERAAGFSSALPGANLIEAVELRAGQVHVHLAAAVEEAGRSDGFLAFGQVVCTLDARPDVVGVVFLRQAQPVAVPRGDGSLSPGPLTLADYANLVSERSATPGTTRR
ncbi:MAG TPA: GerMN domain-containing protein [Micromonosporaceae bacterium]